MILEDKLDLADLKQDSKLHKHYYEIEGDAIKLFIETKLTGIAFAHGCNCANSFGAGIARQVRKELPELWMLDKKLYLEKAKFFDKVLGVKEMLGTIQGLELESDKYGASKYALNFYTQLNYWKDGATIKGIWDCLTKFKTYAKEHKIEYLIVPFIGAGLGGLDWTIDVRPLFLELVKESLAEGHELKVITVKFKKEY